MKRAERWLLKSYEEAAHWATGQDSEARKYADWAVTWAESRPWPGRTGAVDRQVFLAHAHIAYRAGKLSYAASSRELAEHAGVSHMTATRATWRLCKMGLLILERKAVADCANVYGLCQLDEALHSLNTSNVRKCNSLSSDDVFLQRGLGKSAGEVWQVLQEQAATVNELSKLTGRHPRTNKRAIRRMMDLPDLFTGEYLPMAASEDGIVFYSLPVDLDALARILGTAGLGKRQMEKHRKERFAHRQSLLAGRKNIKQDPQTSRDNRDV